MRLCVAAHLRALPLTQTAGSFSLLILKYHSFSLVYTPYQDDLAVYFELEAVYQLLTSTRTFSVPFSAPITRTGGKGSRKRDRKEHTVPVVGGTDIFCMHSLYPAPDELSSCPPLSSSASGHSDLPPASDPDSPSRVSIPDPPRSVPCPLQWALRAFLFFYSSHLLSPSSSCSSSQPSSSLIALNVALDMNVYPIPSHRSQQFRHSVLHDSLLSDRDTLPLKVNPCQ